MKKIDHLALSGNSLKTFLVVLEELSVSKAAERLGVTQSAVSHNLDKLRLLLGDPLFVRSGRNITATDRAISLREPVREALDQLRDLTSQRVFDPQTVPLEFTVAANDFQRDLVFPSLLKDLREKGIDITINFIPSNHPTPELLRIGQCQLLLSPFPPEGPDIYQKRLFDDEMVCYYDSKCRNTPQTDIDFLTADYIEVGFKDLSMVLKNHPYSKRLKQKITVPSFSDTAVFLKNSDMLTIQLSLMKHVYFQDFSSAPLPYKTEPLTMYMVWHKREHIDPASKWFRQQVESRIIEVVG